MFGPDAEKGRWQRKTKQKQCLKSSPLSKQEPVQRRLRSQQTLATADAAHGSGAAEAKKGGKTSPDEPAEQQPHETLLNKRPRRRPGEWWKSEEKSSSQPQDRRLPMSAGRKARARSALKKASKENAGGHGDAYDFPSNLEEEFDNLTTSTPMVPICK